MYHTCYIDEETAASSPTRSLDMSEPWPGAPQGAPYLPTAGPQATCPASRPV